LLEGVFRPVATAFVPLFVRLRVPPPAVVLANAAVGLLAAFAVARGELVTAALLLQLKTLLDNLDGQLARATRRVTLVGRYLDTLADLAVNATLFVALGYVTGEAVLAAVGFVALTIVLAVDFNVTELHREALGAPSLPPARTGSPVERALAGLYDALLGPLDRGVRALARRRFGGLVSYDRATLTILANLGLTTQLVVLGACLLAGRPEAYLWFAIACLLSLVPLQLRAERRARAAIAS
jgi:phosphatidylglycerophosphate synthase